MKLLFLLAHWHGLAKLRMHTDSTLEVLSQVTMSLANHLCEFEEKTCAVFHTRELERERAARQRRQEREMAKGSAGSGPTNNNTRKPKSLNLKTYTYHALGDYVSAIRRYGTTDSYSTQSVRSRSLLIDGTAHS